jgi:hypothetical protein
MQIASQVYLHFVEGVKSLGVREVEIINLDFGSQQSMILLKTHLKNVLDKEPYMIQFATGMTDLQADIVANDLMVMFRIEAGHYCKISLNKLKPKSLEELKGLLSN